jgi:hypothetical protein
MKNLNTNDRVKLKNQLNHLGTIVEIYKEDVFDLGGNFIASKGDCKIKFDEQSGFQTKSPN